MKVILDHNLPRKFSQRLSGHDVQTTRQMQWEELKNGMLLRSAASAGFDVFLTVDKKWEYEQNLSTLPLPVVVIDSISNAMPDLETMIPTLLRCLSSPLVLAIYVVQRDGTTVCITSPR